MAATTTNQRLQAWVDEWAEIFQPDCELPTRGFFFRPTGAEEGLLGLPVLQPGGGGRAAVYGGAQGSASVVYLRQRELSFAALGSLRARPGVSADDGCKASCVDWYGNARPIFTGGRVFALMGYELVEGRLDAAERAELLARLDRSPVVVFGSLLWAILWTATLAATVRLVARWPVGRAAATSCWSRTTRRWPRCWRACCRRRATACAMHRTA